MWRRQLKMALYCSMALVLCACSYHYKTIRCVKTITVPKADHDSITVTVNFTAYIACIQDNRDIARINNDAARCICSGDVDGALALLHSNIASTEPAVLNNYGVALILNGDFDMGYQYICKAAILQPGNAYFRKNYLYLHELKH